jgi:predicted phosphodiesterase
MSIRDEFNKFVQTGKEGSDKANKETPENWRPRSEIDEKTGGWAITSARTDGNTPGAEELLRDANLNPEEWTLVSSRRGSWQKWDGEWLHSWRINVVPSACANADYDAEKLIDEIIKWRPTGKVNDFEGDLTAVYSVGDTQYGKDDTPAIVDRMFDALNESVEHHKFLQKKYKIGQIALPQLGDCIEGMTSQKGKVMGRHDIGVSQQVQVGRRVLMAQIKMMAPLASKLIIPVVPGNHDEVQRFLVSRSEDSWALEIVKAVEDACMENPFLKERVEFRYPAKDDSTLCVNLIGIMFGMAHGHQARDMVKWWSGQVMGNCSVADAEILNVGHLHHYYAKSVGTRMFIQNPAMDNGSSWFRDKAGLESHPGIVSMVVGSGFDTRRELVVLGGFR